MSKIKIEGNASGTGTLTIAAPNTNTDRTLTLPDADITLGGGVDGVDSDYTSGTAVKIDSSGNVGIGTTTPSNLLDVRGTSATDLISGVFTTTASGASDDTNTIHLGCSGSTSYGTTIKAKKDNSSDAHSLYFGTSTNGAAPVDHVRIDKTGNLYFNSGYGSVATAYGCRAWVNFKGDGTVAIRDSGNVSSITDNGTGDYTINFTTAMPDTNYSTSWSSTYSATTSSNYFTDRIFYNYATSSVRCFGGNGGGVGDSEIVCVQIFR